jgi:hypothetical protein
MNQGLTIESVVLGLILDYDPQDVRQLPGDKWRDECNEKKGE